MQPLARVAKTHKALGFIPAGCKAFFSFSFTFLLLKNKLSVLHQVYKGRVSLQITMQKNIGNHFTKLSRCLDPRQNTLLDLQFTRRAKAKVEYKQVID